MLLLHLLWRILYKVCTYRNLFGKTFTLRTASVIKSFTEALVLGANRGRAFVRSTFVLGGISPGGSLSGRDYSECYKVAIACNFVACYKVACLYEHALKVIDSNVYTHYRSCLLYTSPSPRDS